MPKIQDIIENPHPIYKANFNYWDFLLQSYEGGFNYTSALITGKSNQADSQITSMMRYFVNGVEQVNQVVSNGNLFMHPKETVEDYNRRLRMSYYYNFCSPIIDIYKNHLFRSAVLSDYESIEEDVLVREDNIDLKNSSISEFRKELAETAQLYGHCFVVIDSPQIESNIITRKDQIDLGAFPYLSIFQPQNIVNWSLDRFGDPYWVVIRENEDANVDVENYDKNKQVGNCFYRLWTRDAWYRYDSDYKLIDSGVNEIGVVPIVCVFDKRSKMAKNFYGISAIADISFIARDVFNACSELRQILRDQTFAFLALQGNSSEYNELSVGTSKGLLYPEGRNAPVYVSPPSDNARTYFEHIDRQISKIYQLAKLEGGSASFNGQTAVQQSGVSKAWDFNQTNASLVEKASNLEDGEIKIWQIYSKWLGKEFDGSIQYPNEFSVTSLFDDMKEAELSARLELGATFNKEVKKAIQQKKFPRAKDEDLEKMENELDAIGQGQDRANDLVRRFNFLRDNKNAIPSGE